MDPFKPKTLSPKQPSRFLRTGIMMRDRSSIMMSHLADFDARVHLRQRGWRQAGALSAQDKHDPPVRGKGKIFERHRAETPQGRKGSRG